ncbi:MAG: CrcB family protein [bacterium]|nr:CrcB family protein [bacterium]
MNAAALTAVACAGAVGAVCRYVLTECLRGLVGGFPLHTLVVNLVGCLAFGVCFGLGHERWSTVVQAGVFAGFLGSFTTFSTFAFDGRVLLADGRWLLFAGNVIVQNGLGVLAIVGGIAMASAFRSGG